MWTFTTEVSSLQHLCRMAIRRVFHSTSIDRLHLPTKLKLYLRYLDIFPPEEHPKEEDEP